MKIVTSPMCEKILEIAGITNYIVNKNPDEEDGDLAIILSETKTKMPCINLKLNTFAQIRNSIIEVSKYSDINRNNSNVNNTISNSNIDKIFSNYSIANDFINKISDNNSESNYIKSNSKINVLVVSKFLSEIVNDMGFNVVNTISTIDNGSNDINNLINNAISNYNFDYLVFPDYININNSIDTNFNFINVPSHKNVS
ncbi:MAG: hypothetical protein ACRC1M_08085, partial [Methanobacteriaceae archaeon]